jgi:hypothetical protein
MNDDKQSSPAKPDAGKPAAQPDAARPDAARPDAARPMADPIKAPETTAPTESDLEPVPSDPDAHQGYDEGPTSHRPPDDS